MHEVMKRNSHSYNSESGSLTYLYNSAFEFSDSDWSDLFSLTAALTGNCTVTQNHKSVLRYYSVVTVSSNSSYTRTPDKQLIISFLWGRFMEGVSSVFKVLVKGGWSIPWQMNLKKKRKKEWMGAYSFYNINLNRNMFYRH